jgi:serine/threonine protein kinase/predicted Zn-dependent protease
MTPDRNAPDDRSAQLDGLLFEYIDRLNAGEILDPTAIERDHPEIAGAIIDGLQVYRALEEPRVAPVPAGTIGDYTLRRQIGRGGMGVVYEAWQNSLDRQVALKVLPAGIAADNRAFMRFMQEAKTAAKLSHPNVVGVYGMGVEQNTPYFAMEFVEGETLAQVLAKDKASEPEAETPFGKKDSVVYFAKLAEAFADVADGLQHAHSRRIIHRDIKPSNLILDREGHLRILDFGLARLEGQESLTISGDVVGTPHYMSPEQAKRKKIPVDHRTDVYSLGATMYEVLTGRPPFRGKDHADTLSQIIERDPVEPTKVNRRVPKDLETIVLKCLRKDAGDRYGTAEALGQDLRRFVRGDPIEARPQAKWERIVRRAWRIRTRVAGLGALAAVLALSLLLGLKLADEARRSARAVYEKKVIAAVMRIEQASLARSSEGPEGLSLVRGPDLRAEDSEFLDPGGVERLAAALRDLDEAVRLSPSRLDAHYQRARALVILGQGTEALAALDRVLALDPRFLPALVLEAGVLDHLGKHAAAGELRDRARRSPASGWGRPWLAAHTAFREGRWREAAAAFGELLEISRRGEEPYLGFSIAARLGRGAARLEAKEHLAAMKDFAVAEEAWPEALEPVLFEGKALFLMGKLEEAEARFQELYAQSEFKHEVSLAVADLYFWRGEHGRQIEWLGRCRVDRHRERVTAFAWWCLGRFDEAFAAAEAALALKEDDPYSLWTLAHLLVKSGKAAEAVEVCGRAVDLAPQNAYFREQLGFHLLVQGELEASVEELEMALELNPRQNLAHGFLARALFQLGRKEEAFEVHEKGVKVEPRNAELHYHHGRDLLQDGQVEKAIEALQRALALDPVFSWPRAHLGEALEKSGRLEDAEEAYRTAALGFPRDTRSYILLALLLEKQGRRRDAFIELTQALELEPAHSDAHAKLAKLLPAVDPSSGSEEVDGLLATIEKGLGRMPGDPRLLRTYALAAFHHPAGSQIAKALELLERALPEAGARRSEVLGVIAELHALEGRAGEAVLRLEEALRLPGARRPLALQLDACRRTLLPAFVSFASIDAALERPEVEEIVPEGAAWQIVPGWEEPSAGLEWTRLEFNDEAWKEALSGFGYGDAAVRTALDDMQGGYSTLYARKVFDLAEDPRRLRLVLGVKADDGFVAYLDGKEVARARAGEAGKALRHGDLASSDAPEPLAPVEASVAVEGLASGPHCLAVQGLNNSLAASSDFVLSPALRAELRPEPASRRELLEAFRSSGAARAELIAYFEGRLLAAAGDHVGAASLFRQAAAAVPQASEPLLRLLESLRAARDPGGAEEALRRALGGGLAEESDLWRLWAVVSLVDLARSPAEVLAGLLAQWPSLAAEEAGAGADLRWLLEELSAGRALRIDCGGEGQARADGTRWSRDRFFQGGEGAAAPSRYLRFMRRAGDVAGTEDDALHLTQRRFAPDQHLPAGYRLPVPPGSYAVTLHFAELDSRRAGKRVFDVLCEGQVMVESHDPVKAGFRAAGQVTFRSRVSDGVLDLILVPREGSPAVAALEVERVE